MHYVFFVDEVYLLQAFWIDHVNGYIFHRRIIEALQGKAEQQAENDYGCQNLQKSPFFFHMLIPSGINPYKKVFNFLDIYIISLRQPCHNRVIQRIYISSTNGKQDVKFFILYLF